MKELFFTAILLSAITCNSKTQSAQSAQDTVAVSSSPDTNVPGAMHDTNSIAGEWQLMPVLASDTATGKIPFINFDLKTNRFSGNTGCNSMSGNFEINKDALKFNENVISTKMACPGYNEQPFFDNLLKTNRYVIKNGVLQLMYNTTILSQWVRHTNANPSKQI